MVHIRNPIPQTEEGSVDIDTWIQSQDISKSHTALIKNACQLARLTGEDQPTRFGSNCFLQGLELAEILNELKLDPESIATAIIFSTAKNTDLSIEDVSEQLNDNVAKLLHGVLQLGMINLSHQNIHKQSMQQIDNVRRMILAMVQDVRVVVIKLAERLSMMRTLKNFSEEFRRHIAQETMEIFAPLANRLGLHQIKWELEDLAFFHLEHKTYMEIAKNLDEKRTDRDKRVNKIVATINDSLKQNNINAGVYGRAKHIYSIRRKMLRKNVDFAEIYDSIAVRILVPETQDCYQALSIVHELWQPIAEEFDDYVTQPKANGYQSIHTAVIDDNSKYFEIQIRTHAMHEAAELGVAAHWIYKEGPQRQSSYEKKISWLRELLDWQKELTHNQETPEHLQDTLFEDRVYVFTPTDDVIDLTLGSTPLDFAYHIHTQVGHRCRGAKVNGKIVPLTYQLQTGDKVEILTNNKGEPSRDWMVVQRGYLKTSAARSKVSQFFKRKDFESHVTQGKENIEKEMQRLHLTKEINFAQIAAKLNFKSPDLMFAALTTGNTKLAHILSAIKTAASAVEIKEEENDLAVLAQPSKSTDKQQAVSIHGMDNLLTKIARCCKPIPGDKIIGYITQNQGITIHHLTCNNIKYAKEHQPKRLIEVEWNQMSQKIFPVDIEIIAHERQGLVKDISTTIANEKVRLLSLATSLVPQKQSVKIKLTIEIHDIEDLGQISDRLLQIPNIFTVKRPQKTL